jgi:hypothetical protein
MSNSWRALARMARDQIVATPSSDTALILDVSPALLCSVQRTRPECWQLWSLRLASLARMRLFNQATAECANLFSVLSTISPPSTRRQIVPYELDVLRARTMYWSGDLRGYLDELVRLIRMCKRMARAKPERGEAAVWAERGMRTGMMVVTQLVEMQVRAWILLRNGVWMWIRTIRVRWRFCGRLRWGLGLRPNCGSRLRG